MLTTEARIYQVPVEDEDAPRELVAESVEEFLMLLNEERIDTENNYFFLGES
jgi:hypothetical protein